MRPVLDGEIEKRQQCVAILQRAIDGLVVFLRVFLYFSTNVVMAKSALARTGDSQISRKYFCAFGCTDLERVSRMFNVLSTQQR